MNKLIIPAILVATVMVAGIFAFMPVEQATTVHTTILAQQSERDVAVHIGTDIGVGTIDLIDVTVDKDFTVEIGQFLVDSTSTGGTVIVEQIIIEDGAGVDFETINISDVTVTADTGQTVFPDSGVHQFISLPANWSIVIEGSGGNANSDSKVMLGIIAAGDATITVTGV